MMEPLRLTWTLATPLASGAFPIHLDALVAYAVTEDALRAGADPALKVRELSNDLPLQRANGEAGAWCWKASALRGKTRAHSMRMWVRKTDPCDLADRIDRNQIVGRWRRAAKDANGREVFAPFAYAIDLQRGVLKNHFQFFPVRHVHTLEAWCIGDRDRLLELLDPSAGLITGIGPRVRSGFGRVLAFSIERDEVAEQHWMQRVLPWEAPGTVAIQAAHKPPYWAPENRFAASWVSPEIMA